MKLCQYVDLMHLRIKKQHDLNPAIDPLMRCLDDVAGANFATTLAACIRVGKAMEPHRDPYPVGIGKPDREIR